MKGTIFINRTDHAERFVKIGNELAQDYDTLSATAFGWLVRILSRPPTWSLNMVSLECRHHGRHSIRAAMMELRVAGFVVACTRHTPGKFASTEYHVFDQPQTADQIQTLCEKHGTKLVPVPAAALAASRQPSVVGQPAVRKADSGKPNTIKTELRKDRDEKRTIPNGMVPAADATEGEDPSGLNPGDLALLNEIHGESESPDFSEPPPSPSAPPAPAADLALVSEDEPNGQTFPWRQLMAAVKRIVPEVVMPTGAARRDHAMKQFWRKHGKTVGCFERLAQMVAESDFIMARGGHTGNNGRPYSWGWIFSKDKQDRLRADRIMEGEFATEKMAFVLEKKAKEAAPKTKKVFLIGDHNPSEIMPDAKLDDGRPRYRLCEETRQGLPVYLDRGSRT
jgi:hypothetical protein